MSVEDFIASWSMLVVSFMWCLLVTWLLFFVARNVLDVIDHVQWKLRVRARARRAASA
jgi:hypothetical protein